MINRVTEAINRFGLIKKGDTVTVALSGGADSVCLLNILLKLKEELNITVNAAHFNHMIRGEEAFRDEAFVKALCENLGVELFLKRADVPEFANQKCLSLELAARKLRYEFLEQVATGSVATAHNAKDNIETVIFNLCRGSGIDGLCGIPPKRDGFIRPLILCEREEIEKYCQSNNIPFVTDSTNLSDAYTRNKIRHKVIPVLKEINPSLESAVLRTGSLLRETAFLLENLSRKYLEKHLLNNSCLSVEELKDLEPIVAKTILKSFAERLIKDAELKNIHIEKLYDVAISGGKCSLPKGFSACLKNKELCIFCEDCYEKAEFSLETEEIANTFFNKNQKVNNLLLKSLIDCDKIVGKSVARGRLPSDKIRLLNRGCTKSLKDLFSEAKIPLAERDILPVLADDKGPVWVYGFGVAERCAVTANTKRVLRVTAKREVLK